MVISAVGILFVCAMLLAFFGLIAWVFGEMFGWSFLKQRTATEFLMLALLFVLAGGVLALSPYFGEYLAIGGLVLVITGFLIGVIGFVFKR